MTGPVEKIENAIDPKLLAKGNRLRTAIRFRGQHIPPRLFTDEVNHFVDLMELKLQCKFIYFHSVFCNMKPIPDIHSAAVAKGEHSYIDPETGYQVFTEIGLQARGECCGAGCRHCPWHHQNMPLDKRVDRVQQPAWMWERLPDPDTPVSVLFWSGGKDSYLAACRVCGEDARLLPKSDMHEDSRLIANSNLVPISDGLDDNQQIAECNLVLLTTFDARLRKVAHQEIPITGIVSQARALDLPLLGVPLTPGDDWAERVALALQLVPKVSQLVFGDLHLEHIREWRIDALKGVVQALGCELAFPLWHADYGDLLDELEASQAQFVISAVTHEALQGRVGQPYTREFALNLPDGIDPFGENGEFHTRVDFDHLHSQA